MVFTERSRFLLVYVTEGEDRRTTGTQYTPRSLTGPVVQYTLEPLVYVGPAEGTPRERWQLRSAKDLLNLKVCDMTCGSGAFLVETCRYLADRLLEAWELVEKEYPTSVRITPEGKPSSGNPAELLIPKDPNERLIYARRLIAQQCLYGVDKNMLAVEMAKLSLWLLTLEQNRAFTFVDHAIRCGDSLLGVTRREQVEDFDFESEASEVKQISLWKKASKVLFDQALLYRQRLEASPVMTVEDIQQKEELLKQAEQATSLVRLLCDLLTAAAISTATGKSPKKGDAFSEKRAALWQILMETYHHDENVESWRNALLSMETIAHELLNEGKSSKSSTRHPFHWPVEFPEVFVDRAGFDAIVGNPPFMGGQKITGVLGTDYRNYLVGFLASGTRGSADLCAYFFLRALELIRQQGGFGLLATNTIAQGDTREVGLDRMLERGDVISRATSSRKWPGQANIEIAEVWMRSNGWNGETVLDGVPVSKITAQLTTPGRVEGKPHRLAVNQNKCFQGSNLLGLGFTMSPEKAKQLIAKDAKNADVLLPFINGEDLNSRADQSPTRWVINFRDWPLDRLASGSWETLEADEQKRLMRVGTVTSDYPGPVAADYSDCLLIVERDVKPDRDGLASGDATARDRARRWWQFARPTIQLYEAIAGLPRVLVVAATSRTLAFVFARTPAVFSHATYVFALNEISAFAVLQSMAHDYWARRQASTMKKDLRYTPSDCLDTFAFPQSLTGLEKIGDTYYRHRSEIMQERKKGLTATYDRFHDKNNHDTDIEELRRLQIDMDHTVAAVYGWQGLDLDHAFYETKHGPRFTISDATGVSMLDRLLRLNHERYAEEVAAGKHDKDKKESRSLSKNQPYSPALF